MEKLILKRAWLACAAVVALTAVVYAPVHGFDFVNLDDDAYVRGNPRVRQGLSWENVRWAFADGLTERGPRTDYWLPLSTISHMTVVELFGIAPGPHHVVNVLFHLGNTIALFILLARITGRSWCSVIVAGLFALHPLRVESVAWIAERKDVMSAFFGLATLLAWHAYTRDRRRSAYALAIVFFALGLMSKPMVITLPALMLLLDAWPLKRTAGMSRRQLLLEKVPFMVLSLVSAVLMTVLHPRGASDQVADASLAYRVSNALTAYVVYLRKIAWPSDLAVYYPDRAVPVWLVAVCATVLVAITAVCIGMARRKPYLAVGWFWYLGMLVPVIGLLNVYGEFMADRFTYLPSVGIFVAIVWMCADAAGTRPRARLAAGVVVCVGLIAFAVVAARTLQHWRGGEALFRRALLVTRDNHLAHNALGHALTMQGRRTEAVEEFERALAVKPDYSDAHNNLGATLLGLGDAEGAALHFRQAIDTHPGNASAYNNLAWVLAESGAESSKAVDLAEHACALTSHAEPAYLDTLAVAYSAAGRPSDAVRVGRDAADIARNLGYIELAREIEARLKRFEREAAPGQ